MRTTAKKISGGVRVGNVRAHHEDMQMLGLMVEETDEGLVAEAIRGLSDADLTRLQGLARLRARTLPGIEWSDLLHEAIVRALDGSRRWPTGVPILAFLAQSMRSIEHDHRRRQAQENSLRSQTVFGVAAADTATTIAARQALDAIFALFAADTTVLRIIEGLAHGRSAAEIRARHDMPETEYDSARKRLRRALLRPETGGRLR